MMEQNKKIYDAIIIGAGNAGLSCALALADAGKKVLLVERNIVPGGAATSFVRGRFEFEPSLHELSGTGSDENPKGARALIQKYHMNVELVSHKDAFRVIVRGDDGYDVTMPSGLEEFIDAMEKVSPGSREPLNKIFAMQEKIEDALAYFDSGKQNPLTVVLKYREFMKAASHSTQDAMDYFELPKKAQRILSTYWPYLGVPPEKIDFMHYMQMLCGYIKDYPTMPRYRSHEISTAFVDAIEKRGGEVWFNTEVTGIYLENGKAAGVKIGDKIVKCKKVVSSCFPEKVMNDMLPERSILSRHKKLSNARKYGITFFTIYLGLNKTKEELGIKDYTVFIYDSNDPNQQYEDMKDYKHAPLFVNCLNEVIPDASPKGTSMMYFTIGLDSSFEMDCSEDNYFEWKEKIAKYLIEKYETTLGIKIADAIEEIELCSPATFSRYLGTPNGTAYGYELSLWDSIVARIQSIKNERLLDNLFFAGAHAENGDGYSAVYLNGQNVAKRVLEELK